MNSSQNSAKNVKNSKNRKIYEKLYVSTDFLPRPRFGVLLRSQRGSKNRLRIVKERVGIDFGYAGDPPERDSGSILVDLCVATVVRCIPVLFQVRPKFIQIPDQPLFCPWGLALVALPFSCRGGGRAERVKFAVPRRGAGVVLNQ